MQDEQTNNTNDNRDRILVRLPKDIGKRIRIHCVNEERSLSDFATEAMVQKLNQEQPANA